MIAHLLLASALAAPGTYHPAEIAAQSQLYATASDGAGRMFEERARGAEGLARALEDYELALDLLGDRAPEASRQRLDALTQEYNREFAVLNAFANTMVEDFDGEFVAAMERAIAKHPGAVECEREIAEGKGLPGMPAKKKPNPDCQGADLNAQIAKAMDDDPKLKAAVGEILALTWPELALEAVPEAPIGGAGRAVDVGTLFRQAAPTSLDRIEREDEDARLPFQAAIEEGASTDDLEKLVAQARAVTTATAAKRAAMAGPVLGAAEATAAKWAKKGEPALGWCANPASLGGCIAPDATAELVPRLVADKKVAAALP